MPTPEELTAYRDWAKKYIPDILCYVTTSIYRNQQPVFYIDRGDEGEHIFIAEHDSQAFLDDPANTAICSLREIAMQDPAIVPFLNGPRDLSYTRLPDDDFQPIEQPPSD